MKKIVVILGCIVLTAFSVSAQSKINLEEVAQHMGDSVRVCGKVFGTRFLENSNGRPTLINMGGAYPNELLTVVIYGDDREKFAGKPEEICNNKNICVTGRIVTFKGKAQIIITAPEQLVIQ